MDVRLLPPAIRSGVAGREAISRAWLGEEAALIRACAADLAAAGLPAQAVQARAAGWVGLVRALDRAPTPLDAFMREYDLSSREGVLLMCLAEALLRIPDSATAERLIADKLGSGAWKRHLGHSASFWVNASTWGLLLTGRLVRREAGGGSDVIEALRHATGRLGEPAIRLALRQAMRLMAEQFVMGRDIELALRRAATRPHERHSFDMLGEAALTAADARRYRQAYLHAIDAIGRSGDPQAPITARPGISIKLSALHPRYEIAQQQRVQRELAPVLLELAGAAASARLCLTVDAEEADRLELSLDLIEAVFSDSGLPPWDGFGVAVQACQMRALPLIDWLAALAQDRGRVLQVRLVKGAYWDTEIKRAQEQGLPGYPVFTRKSRTDVHYLACARRLLDARPGLYPMFATHNAHTLAAIHALAGPPTGAGDDFEVQRLHGMGERLHEVVGQHTGATCRVYAPVGSHEDLLPYLVRRLLENGANTGFVNRLHDERMAPEALAADPVDDARSAEPSFPRPCDRGSDVPAQATGLNLADVTVLQSLAGALAQRRTAAMPLVDSAVAVTLPAGGSGRAEAVRAPADGRRILGHWRALDPAHLRPICRAAQAAQPDWDARPAATRADVLDAAAQALEAERVEFIDLLINEAGKTLADADAEVREAIDFLRYYAAQARTRMGAPLSLPGPTGENNELRLHGRGVFACISPWNFPLAIFTGQIAAALASGNTVLAKPAEQTPLIAARMTARLHAAGVPRPALQLLLGDATLGAALVAQPQLAGVAFTGSLPVARRIQRVLAAGDGALAVLIAETGGQNAMIADSSALPEQLIRDVLRSAFGAAGQRCSALRVLYLQDDIAEAVIERLRGAMRELRVGDPARLATDVGPVIDADARARLLAHVDDLRLQGRLIEQLALDPDCAHGTYVAPCLARVDGIHALSEEHFGPILHVTTFRAGDLDAVVEAINASGHGLTLGLHSRIEMTWQQVAARARVGNLYINRAMTGAVVGSQPFGGEGLSGTGPKAGGPNYLTRFCCERALSVNTAAVGGDAGLLNPPG